MTTPNPTRGWSEARAYFTSRLPMPIRHIASVVPLEPTAVVRRRRQVVAGVSLLGTGLLGVSFATEPDSKKFYGFTAAVAATWTLGGDGQAVEAPGEVVERTRARYLEAYELLTGEQW